MELKVKIISYNIKSCDLCNIEQLINFLKINEFSIILLQEVDDYTSKNYYSIAKTISDSLNFNYYFSSARNKMNGKYGNCIITKYKILENHTICLPEKKLEKRCIQYIKFYIDILKKFVWVYNVHLDWDNTYLVQNKQIDFIYSLINKNYDKNDIVILGGDFNIEKNKINNPKFIIDFYNNYKEVKTWSCKRPKIQLDNILIKTDNSDIYKYIYQYYTSDSKLSDHLPLLCDLNINFNIDLLYPKSIKLDF